VVVTNPAPGGGSSSAVSFTVSATNPVPTVTSLSPSSLTAGATTQTLTINGSGFLSASTVTYNSVAHTATYVSASQLTISLATADLATAGSYPVVVTNPAPGGGSSSAVSFTVSATNPVPTVTSLSPSSLTAGATAQTLTITGTGFLSASTVTYNGLSHAASFVDSNHLKITLTTTDLSTAGTYPLVVTNPSPGGGTSNPGNFVVTPPGSNAGNIFTVAGDSSSGFSGDGGLATNAQLNAPWGVTADSFGNLYIADTGNHVIRKIDTIGMISTVAGQAGNSNFGGDGGPATSAQLEDPISVLTDAAGNLYIAEQTIDSTGGFVNGARIRKVDNTGTITTIAGGATSICSTATDSLGDGCSATSAILLGAWGLAMDSKNNLYVSDYFGNRVRQIGTNGVITSVAGNGTKGYSGDGKSATNAELYGPAGLSVDPSDNIYLADSQNNVVRKLTSTGIITTVVGNGAFAYSGDGGLATDAGIDFPFGPMTDPAGNLFISELGGHGSAVREVDTAGKIETVAGNANAGYGGDGGPASSAALAFPHGIALDTSGNLYIADTSNNRIREILTAAAPTNVAVQCTVPSFAPASEIVGYFPSSLILDSSFHVTNSYDIYYSGSPYVVQATAEFSTGESPQSVFNVYKSLLVSAGWTITNSNAGGTLLVIYAAKGGFSVNMTVTPATSSGSNVTVSVVLPVNGFSCSGSSTIAGVSLVCSPSSIQTGQTSTCTPTVTGTGSYSSAVTWSVSPSTIGTVSSGGVFTPSLAGTATITATSTEDTTKSGQATVTVATGTALMVSITDLPAGTAAKVTLTDPNGQQTTLTASQTISAIPGTYTIVAAPVVAGTNTYNAILPTQTVVVTAGNAANATVDYKNVVPANTKVLDAAALSGLSVSSDGLTLTMPASSSVAQSLGVGNVIVVPPTSASGVAPMGMLRKVVSIASSNGEVVAITQRGTLADAFQRVGFLLQTQLTSTSIQAVRTAPGVIFRQGASMRRDVHSLGTSDPSDPCAGYSLGVFDVTKSIETDAMPGLTLSGSVEICSGLNFGVDIVGTGFLGLQPAVNSLTATASMGESSDLTLEGDFLSGYFNPAPVTLGTLDLPPIEVPGLPVWITPEVSVFVGASGNISSGISTEVSAAGSFTGGVTYGSGAWSPVPLTPSFQFAYQPPTLNASLSAKAYAGIEFDLYVYDVVGPSFKPDGYLDLEANIANNPWWTLTGGIEGPMSLDVTFLGENLASYDLGTLFDYSYPILSANGPFLPSSVAPAIQSITPQQVTAGASSFNLNVVGSNFLPGATVNFGSTSLATTYQSPSQLTTSVPSSLVTSAGTFQVSVTNPGTSNTPSNSKPFTVAANNPVPTITLPLVPSSLPAGSAAQTLTINGTGFLTSSTVTFNGTDHAAAYVNATQLTISLTSADLTTAGSYSVKVTNPVPGGGPSNSVVFTVSASVTGISVSPSSVTVPVGAVQTFAAIVPGGGSATWSVKEGAGGGSITSAGIYTAPASTGTYHVVATNSANSAQTATATVSVVAATAYSVLYSFSYAFESASLIQATDGNFYGTNEMIAYKIGESGTFTQLAQLSSSPSAPISSLIQANDGNFYGVNSQGTGSIFKMDTSGNVTTMYSFPNTNSGTTSGAYPWAGLIQGSDGDFYGTTYLGGNVSCTLNSYGVPAYGPFDYNPGAGYGCGTVFKMDSSGNVTVLYSFSGQSDGNFPQAPLIQGADGYFYGTTSAGGANGYGTIFKMDALGNLQVLYSLSNTNGGGPVAALLQAADGNLYGTTTAIPNSSTSGGEVFKIDTAGNNFTVLHTFSGSDGSSPVAPLIQGSDGSFYGTTWAGGDLTCGSWYANVGSNYPYVDSSGCGTVFKMDPLGNITVLHAFEEPQSGDGNAPYAGLILGKDGYLYGTTYYGGTDIKFGTVFRLGIPGV